MFELIGNFLKDNSYILSVISIIFSSISLFILLLNKYQSIRVRNQTTYNNKLKSTHLDLFETDKQSSLKEFNLKSLDNIYEIYSFCYDVVDFKENKNKFKGIFGNTCFTRVNYKFNKLFKIANELNNYAIETRYPLLYVSNSELCDNDYYNENKDKIRILQKCFKDFYLFIFDHL